MFLIEKISNRFAEKIANEMDYDQDKKEVMAYGTHAILQIFFSLLFVVIFGLIFGVLIEALIVSFSTSILRKYSGGVHAASPAICMIVGTVACIGFGLLSIVPFATNLYFVYGYLIITFFITMMVFIKLAPVASSAKPISDKKKVRMKKGSLIALGIYLIITTALLFGFYMSSEPAWLRYVFSLLCGTLWQAFTLTKAGEVVLGGLNKVLMSL